MITGFNTDIEHGGVTYHVQTEDKGAARPIILSLVYDRGTILASKRSPYDDLIAAGLDEKILGERLHRQHSLICAAVRAGRIEDLKKMAARDAASKQAPEAAEVTAAPVTIPAIAKPNIPLPSFDPDSPIPRPGPAGYDPLDLAFAPLVEDVTILDADDLVPDEAVEIVPDPASFSRASGNALSIEILGDATFRGGDHRDLGLMVCRGNGRKVVADTEIMVKILGSSFRPIIFHARTDANGIARINIQLPKFTSGRAALLVRAISDGEETELRRSIAHG